MRAKRISCALLGLAAALTLAAQPLAAQTPKAQPHTGAPKSARPLTKAAAKAPALTPLSDRERVVQRLDRFTFGVRPGDVERVLAGGEDERLGVLAQLLHQRGIALGQGFEMIEHGVDHQWHHEDQQDLHR